MILDDLSKRVDRISTDVFVDHVLSRRKAREAVGFLEKPARSVYRVAKLLLEGFYYKNIVVDCTGIAA